MINSVQRKSLGMFRTTGVLGLGNIATRVCNLGVIAALSHAAGAAAVGRYGLATLVASFLALSVSLGFPTYLTRQRSAGVVDAGVVRSVHALRFVLVAGGAIATWVVCLAAVPHIATGFAAFAGAALLDQWNETAWSMIRGTAKGWLEACVNGTTYATLMAIEIAAAFTGVLTFTSAGIIALFAATARSGICCAVTGMGPTPRALRAVPATVRAHARNAAPYLASDVLGLAYLRGDTFILALFVSTKDVGLYVSATALVSPLVQVASSMSMGALAAAATSERRDAEQQRVAESVVRYFAITGVMVTVALILAIPVMGAVLYGGHAKTVRELSIVLALFLPLRFLNFGLSSLILAQGLAAKRLMIVMLSVGVNVALNLALDGWLGALGAALATVATEVIVTASFLLLGKIEGIPRACTHMVVWVIIATTLGVVARQSSWLVVVLPIACLVISSPLILRALRLGGRHRRVLSASTT